MEKKLGLDASLNHQTCNTMIAPLARRARRGYEPGAEEERGKVPAAEAGHVSVEIVDLLCMFLRPGVLIGSSRFVAGI
jgi:hypothetical protein